MLLSCLATTPELSEAFSDAAALRAMLDFESALARVEMRLGVIPPAAHPDLQAADFDIARIAAQARADATPAIPFLRELHVASPNAHWGATSQDLCDTAMSLLLRRAWPLLRADHRRIAAALRRLSDAHAATPTLSRTLLQPASPVTFGWKAAGWYVAIETCWNDVETALERAAILQFGGADGTLSGLGSEGPAIAAALAQELGLPEPAGAWHARRDRLAAFVGACAVYAGALGKAARDIASLMQFEIAEVSEGAPGTSSAMPHKRNPSGCAVALAAAQRLPGFASTMLSLLLSHEHERAAGAWQAEWPVLAEAVQCTGSAAEAMARVLEQLRVFPERMLANIHATDGAVFSERAALTLAREQGRAAAYEAVKRADFKADRDLGPYVAAAETYRQRLLRAVGE